MRTFWSVRRARGRVRDVACLDPPLADIDPGVDKGGASPSAAEQIGHYILSAHSQGAKRKFSLMFVVYSFSYFAFTSAFAWCELA